MERDRCRKADRHCGRGRRLEADSEWRAATWARSSRGSTASTAQESSLPSHVTLQRRVTGNHEVEAGNVRLVIVRRRLCVEDGERRELSHEAPAAQK